MKSCENPCQNVLDCGHKCELICHDGPCVCSKETVVKCKCHKSDKTIKCTEVKNLQEFVCDEVCNSFFSCGIHRCSVVCCPLKPFGTKAFNIKEGISHICKKICQKKLTCGHECG